MSLNIRAMFAGRSNTPAAGTATIGYPVFLPARERAIRERSSTTDEIRRQLLLNGGSVSLTAAQLDVGVNRVRAVKDEFGIASDPSLNPPLHGDRSAEKAAVREALEAGASVKAAVRMTGVPESTIRRWRDEFAG
jgi:transposase-like protein